MLLYLCMYAKQFLLINKLCISVLCVCMFLCMYGVSARMIRHLKLLHRNPDVMIHIRAYEEYDGDQEYYGEKSYRDGVHTYIQYIHVFPHTNIHTYLHSYAHIYTHSYIHSTYIHTKTSLHTCIHAYIHTKTNVHTYIHMHVYIHVRRCIWWGRDCFSCWASTRSGWSPAQWWRRPSTCRDSFTARSPCPIRWKLGQR